MGVMGLMGIIGIMGRIKNGLSILGTYGKIRTLRHQFYHGKHGTITPSINKKDFQSSENMGLKV